MKNRSMFFLSLAALALIVAGAIHQANTIPQALSKPRARMSAEWESATYGEVNHTEELDTSQPWEPQVMAFKERVQTSLDLTKE